MKKQSEESTLQRRSINSDHFHYSIFLEIVKRYIEMPDPDRHIIITKPSSYDSGRYSKFRLTCLKWGIHVRPLGKTKRRKIYDRNRQLTANVKKLRSRLELTEKERDQYKAQAEARKLHPRV